MSRMRLILYEMRNNKIIVLLFFLMSSLLIALTLSTLFFSSIIKQNSWELIYGEDSQVEIYIRSTSIDDFSKIHNYIHIDGITISFQINSKDADIDGYVTSFSNYFPDFVNLISGKEWSTEYNDFYSVWLSKSASESYHLYVGDKFDYYSPKYDLLITDVTVIGIYEDNEILNDIVLSTKFMGIYEDVYGVRILIDKESYHDAYDILNEVDSEKLMDTSFISIYNFLMIVFFAILGLATIFVFITILIINNYVKLLIMKKRKYIYMMRAIGYNTEDIFYIYFVFVFIIINISIFLSYFIYIYMSDKIIDFMSIIIHINKNDVNIYSYYFVFYIVLVLLAFVSLKISFIKIKQNNISFFLKEGD